MAIVGPRWEIYSSEEEGGRRVVTFDLDLANEKTHTPSTCHRVLMRCPVAMVMPTGMLKPEAAVPMRLAEEMLISSLEKAAVRCRLVARTTYAGHREFAFSVEDEGAFTPVVEAWQKKQKWETRVVTHEGWEYFEDAIIPTETGWEQIRNRARVSDLVQAGTDPAAVHVLQHAFAGTPEGLAKIAAELMDGGFTGRPDASRLVLSQDAALDVDEISTTTQMLAIVASEHGASYEGWTAAIIPLPVCR